MPENELDRRRFLRRIGAAFGGFFAMLFGIPAAATVVDPVLRSSAGGWTDAGPLSGVKKGEASRFTYTVQASWEVRKEVGFLVRDGEEVVALSARCTHLGCKVRFNKEKGRFQCPCHGGAFSLHGEPLKSPVTEPLARFEARVEDGQIKVKT